MSKLFLTLVLCFATSLNAAPIEPQPASSTFAVKADGTVVPNSSATAATVAIRGTDLIAISNLATVSVVKLQASSYSILLTQSLPSSTPLYYSEVDSTITLTGRTASAASAFTARCRGIVIVCSDATVDTRFSTSSGSVVTDGDKGSITVSSSGSVWTIDSTSVANSMLVNPKFAIGSTDFTLGTTTTQANTRTAIGVVIGTDVLAYNPRVQAIGNVAIPADGSTYLLGSDSSGTAGSTKLTTVGAAFVGLANPSAITFPRANADNSVSLLSASAFRAAIGAGTGSGDLVASNNLSELSASASTVRSNLGLVIGTNVQAFDSDLASWSSVTRGTGFDTAAAIAVGNAGAFVTFNGAGGTPSSLTGTNITGIPTAGLVNNAVAYAKLQASSAGFTILAKADTGSGNFAELAASTDQVLRRSGSGNLGFGTLVTNNLGDSQVTNAKLANSSLTVNGSSISLGGSATVTANTTNALTAGTGISSAGTFDGSTARTFTINQAFTPSWTGLHTYSQSIAANTVDYATIYTNPTAATNGNQRSAPYVEFISQAWKSNTTAASQTMLWRMGSDAQQGTTIGRADWVLDYNPTGLGWNRILTLSDNYLELTTSSFKTGTAIFGEDALTFDNAGGVTIANASGALALQADTVLMSEQSPPSAPAADKIIVYAKDVAGTSKLAYKDSAGTETVVGPAYLVYTAILTQSGTDAPVATVLQNTLGGSITWSRPGAGRYDGVKTGAFAASKTWLMLQNMGWDGNPQNTLTRIDDDTIELQIADGDDFIQDPFPAFIEIRVYP